MRRRHVPAWANGGRSEHWEDKTLAAVGLLYDALGPISSRLLEHVPSVPLLRSHRTFDRPSIGAPGRPPSPWRLSPRDLSS
jgi:hypothetical protein